MYTVNINLTWDGGVVVTARDEVQKRILNGRGLYYVLNESIISTPQFLKVEETRENT